VRSASRSRSARRSVRVRAEARFFFEPIDLNRQAANLDIQFLQPFLVTGFEGGLGLVIRAEQAGETLERGAERTLTLATQADLLSLNRTGLYYQPVPPSAEEVALKHRIDEIYTRYPFYGSRKIVVALQPDFSVNRKAVQRHMREMGIAGIVPGPNLSKRSAQHQIYPYLLRNLNITRSNQVWGIDITYVRLHADWLYLVAVLDWFSRYVISITAQS
jgi:putative transposase